MVDITNLKGLTHDSRRVKTGYLFAALPGSKTDGCEYIDDAIRNGASVILAPEGASLSQSGIELITDKNPRRAFSLLVAEFYGRQPGYVVAVTGTNGKTSVVHFARQLWKSQDIKAASLGTLGVSGPGLEQAGKMTTPDPVSLHAGLADLAAAGVTHLALEASSHGLDQYRLDGVQVKAAGFTNISHDHLDYHGDMESYRASKYRLFGEVLFAGGTAILNADSQEFKALKKHAEEAGHVVVSYGRKSEDLKIKKITPMPQGQDVVLEVFGKGYELILPLVGEFQVYNALCALGLVLSEDQSQVDDYVSALENLQGAPGRLELITGHPNAAIYVDYAHTPDALENVLKALRPHTQGNLVCLFGCGGERDAKKRPVMGEIAGRLSDVVIVTDDNPRTEDPEKIRKSILKPLPQAIEIPDRRKAINQAIEDLGQGDVLVIAGKGHEQGQVYSDQTIPFDDCEEAAKVIGGLS